MIFFQSSFGKNKVSEFCDYLKWYTDYVHLQAIRKKKGGVGTGHPLQDQSPERTGTQFIILYRQKTVFVISKGSHHFYDKVGLQFNLQIEF